MRQLNLKWDWFCGELLAKPGQMFTLVVVPPGGHGSQKWLWYVRYTQHPELVAYNPQTERHPRPAHDTQEAAQAEATEWYRKYIRTELMDTHQMAVDIGDLKTILMQAAKVGMRGTSPYAQRVLDAMRAEYWSVEDELEAFCYPVPAPEEGVNE